VDCTSDFTFAIRHSPFAIAEGCPAMTTFLLALDLLALFLLLLVRSSLNALSAMAVSKLGEGESPMASWVRAFRSRRLAYQISLQLGLLLTGAAVAYLLAQIFDAAEAPHPLSYGFGLACCLIVALAVVAQLAVAFNPESALLYTLPVLRLFVWLFAVVAVPLAAILSRQLSAHRERQDQEDEDKEEEISALINVGQSEGILEQEDSELIRGVMEFGDTVAREVMTPRTDMVAAPSSASLKDAADLMARARHTRLPLYDGQVDNVVGVAYLKDFLSHVLSGEGERLVSEFMRPVPFVPENKPISALLREFQAQKLQLAIVVDEYGGVDGLVTTEDLVEEIVGEIQEAGEPGEEPFREVSPGVVEALGRASLYDVAERLGVDLPEGDYDSVAGWITTSLGVIPHQGQRLSLDGVDVDVLAADKRRIHKVRATVRREGAASPAQTPSAD
jgi:putative hemolysin